MKSTNKLTVKDIRRAVKRLRQLAKKNKKDYIEVRVENPKFLLDLLPEKP
jgi:nicotinate-nucleotide pyrophosphorylase